MKGSKTALFLILAALALLAPGLAWGAAGEWSINPQSSVRLITAWDVAPRTGELWMGFHFSWPPVGTSTGRTAAMPGSPRRRRSSRPRSWASPSCSGPPLAVSSCRAAWWLSAMRTRWSTRCWRSSRRPPPAPAPAGTPPPEAADAATSEAAEGGEVQITADLDYLVCEVDCIPYRYTLTVEQPMGGEPVADPETAPLIQAWLDRLPRTVQEVQGVTTGAVLDAGQPGQPALEIRVAGVRAAAGKTDLFLETHRGPGHGQAADARSRRTAWSSTCPEAAGDEASRCPPACRSPGRSPTCRQGRQDLQPGGAAATCRWSRAPAVSPPAPAAAPAGGMPRLLLWAFLGGVLLNLMPTVLALLAAEGFTLRGSERPGLREKAAAAATGVLGSCWAFAGSGSRRPALRAAGGLGDAAPGAGRGRPAGRGLGAARPQPVGPGGFPPGAGRRRRGRHGTPFAGRPVHHAAGPGLACAPAPGAARLRLRRAVRRPWPRCSSWWLRPGAALPAGGPGAGGDESSTERRDPGCHGCGKGSGSWPAPARSGCSTPCPAR